MHQPAVAVVRGRAKAHVGHDDEVVAMHRFEFQNSAVQVRGRGVGMASMSVFVFARHHAEQHHGAQTVGEVFGYGLEQNIHRLLVDAGHALDGLVDVLTGDNKVGLNEGRQHPAFEQQVAASCRPAVDAWSDVHLNPSCVLATISRALPR